MYGARSSSESLPQLIPTRTDTTETAQKQNDFTQMILNAETF